MPGPTVHQHNGAVTHVRNGQRPVDAVAQYGGVLRPPKGLAVELRPAREGDCQSLGDKSRLGGGRGPRGLLGQHKAFGCLESGEGQLGRGGSVLGLHVLAEDLRCIGSPAHQQPAAPEVLHGSAYRLDGGVFINTIAAIAMHT